MVAPGRISASPLEVKLARLWLKKQDPSSNQVAPIGSFSWAATMLGLDAHYVRQLVFSEIESSEPKLDESAN